jgi:hypothetical protein
LIISGGPSICALAALPAAIDNDSAVKPTFAA